MSAPTARLPHGYVSKLFDNEPALRDQLVAAGRRGDIVAIDQITDQLVVAGMVRRREDQSRFSSRAAAAAAAAAERHHAR